MSFPSLLRPPARPLELADDEVFVWPCTVGEMVGHGRAKAAVREGFLRPADIDTAELSPVTRIWLPLWRVEGSASSFSVGLVDTTRRTRGPDAGVLGGPGPRPPRSPRGRTRRGLMPTGGYRHHDGLLSLPARRGYPIDPSPKTKIPRASLVPLTDHPLAETERVVPDVPREDATAEAERRLRRRGEPRSALFAQVHVDVRDATLVYVPLYVLRYRYGGDAVEGGAAVFFVAVSGATGKVVASHHPSGWRAMKTKLDRFFGG